MSINSKYCIKILMKRVECNNIVLQHTNKALNLISYIIALYTPILHSGACMYCCTVPKFHNTQYFKSWVDSFSLMRMLSCVAWVLSKHVCESPPKKMKHLIPNILCKWKERQKRKHIKLPKILLHLVAEYCDLRVKVKRKFWQ